MVSPCSCLSLYIQQGYRLDHQPLAIASEKGAEGFSLHGLNLFLPAATFQPVPARVHRARTLAFFFFACCTYLSLVESRLQVEQSVRKDSSRRTSLIPTPTARCSTIFLLPGCMCLHRTRVYVCGCASLHVSVHVCVPGCRCGRL